MRTGTCCGSGKRGPGGGPSSCPPLAAQLALDRLAATDLSAQLAYQDAVRRHHERLKTYFYPVFFDAAPIDAVDWDGVPAFEPAVLEESATRAGFPAAAALLLASILVLGAGARISGPRAD